MLSFRDAIVDEISLEGLEGITLQSLWIYLAEAMKFPKPLTLDLQQQIWEFLLKKGDDNFKYYELPNERPPVKLYNRFERVDAELGLPIAIDDSCVTRYKLAPVQKNKEMGSCEHYNERTKIPFSKLQELNVEDVKKAWGDKFIIVASQTLRLNALLPPNVGCPQEITLQYYCVLEAVGRSRYNGEATSGPYSLMNFCEKSSLVFYYKGKLQNMRLISVQDYSEKSHAAATAITKNTLVTLVRFHRTHKSHVDNVVSKMFERVKEMPKNRLSLSQMRQFMSTIERPQYLKKLTKTAIFKRIFETQAIPWSQLTQDEFELVEKKKFKNTPVKERTESFYCLRNPNMTLDEFVDEEKVEEEDTVDYHSETHSFVDMPTKDAFYRALLRHGARGCTLTELYSYTGISFLILRQFVKLYLRDKAITSYWTDVARTRVQRYVALEFAASAKEKLKAPLDIESKLHCDEEPNIPVTNFLLNDIPEIKAVVAPYTYENRVGSPATTQRQALRKYMVVQMVNERCIVMVSDVRVAIQRTEKEKGYTDEMCNKSVQRLIADLATAKIVSVYQITLTIDECTRVHRYVTHPKIQQDHALMQSEVIRLKTNLFAVLEDRRHRLGARDRELQRQAALKAVAEQGCGSKITVPAYHPSKTPKFYVSRHLHELLFYLVVELNATQESYVITEFLLQMWQRREPTINVDEYYASVQEQDSPNVSAYQSELSWRTFIPPLPHYDDKPPGWVYFPDLLARMPLSIFNKMFRIDYTDNDRMKAVMAHPIKQHYLMLHLPHDLQFQTHRSHLQRVHIMSLKLLNNMGLIQVTEREQTKDPLTVWVYVNRRASIIDTSSTEPSLTKVNAARHYPTLNFHFAYSEQLDKYWTSLQRICYCTKLGFGIKKLGKAKTAIAESEKNRVPEVVFTTTDDYEGASERDTGVLPGDHMGAGGLASHLFSHKLRSWSWVLLSHIKTKQARTSSAHIRKKIHKAVRRKAGGTVTHLHTMPISVSGGVKKKKKKQCGPRDAVDMDALSKMRTLRVSWNQAEDELLNMAWAVYQYVAAPVHLLLLRDVGRIARDAMRHIMNSCNKVTIACVRRMKFIDKMRRNRPDVPNWVHMLRTTNVIQQRYGADFLIRLKNLYPAREEYCEALEKHFVLLLDYLYRYVHDIKPGVETHAPTYLLPDTLAEYEQRFCESPVVVAERLLPYEREAASETDVQVHLVTCVLHSSLCCSRDKTLYNLQAFEIYKHYAEKVLQMAFRKATKDSFVVTVKRRNIKMVPTHLSGPAFMLSSRYRMRLQTLKIPYEVYAIVHACNEAVMQTFGDDDADADVWQVKSPNVGHLFFIAEGLTCNYWSMQIKLPANIITINTEQSQISRSDRIIDHYQNILENAPVTEYSKLQDIEQSEKQIHVKFHRANRCYKLHYTPFDRIAKLPAYQLHFFCALASIDEQADLKCSHLHVPDEEHGCAVVHCPFKCILRDADYMKSIERIVVAHRDVLDTLSEMPPQQLLNLTNSSDLVTVKPTNLLTLVRMLEAFWREKEAPHERKDIGRISEKLRTCSGKSIEWLELCQQILASNAADDNGSDIEHAEKNDAYEPVLDREERILRAQDACVVSLPTLYLRFSEHLAGSQSKVMHNKCLVPEVLLEADIMRESILSKVMNESQWKYTKNTLASILPQLTGFNDMDLEHLQDIHDYIKDAGILGACGIDLMMKFPFDKFLLRALDALREHYLIKRVGIVNVRYVHKAHVREWVVHTFHIKRLEQESLGPGTNKTGISRKRKRIANKDETGQSEELPTSSRKRVRNNSSKAVTTECQSNSNDAEEQPTCSNRAGISSPGKSLRRKNTENAGLTYESVINKEVVIIQPKPWIRLNGSLNRRVLDKWMGSVLTECVANCGIIVRVLCNQFPYLPPVDLLFLLELLCDMKCVRLVQMQEEAVGLFSKYEIKAEKDVEDLYDPSLTYVVALPDAMSRMSMFLGNKKYNVDFI